MPGENQLIDQQEGDLKWVEEVCAGTWEEIYRYIYYKVQNREEAEDITQETYARAISHIKKTNTKIDKHLGFLKAVSVNILRDRWRKKKRRGIIVNFDSINPKEAAVEDSAEISAQREVIREALDKLNSDQRTAIELRILKGYSVAETARIMNKKEGTIRVLQHRSLQTLAGILENKD